MRDLVDPRAEVDYLACCLLDASCLEAGGIGPEALGTGDHRMALSALLAIRQRGEPIDTVTLRTELERLGWPLDRALTYALSLTDRVPPSFASVAARLRLLADARRIVEEGSLGVSHAARLEVDEARERMASAAMSGAQSTEILSGRELMEAAATAWLEISQEREREASGIPPRYVSLDLGRARGSRTLTAAPGDMITVGAATGVGKSSIAVSDMLALEDRGIRSGLVSVEDPKERWGSKIIGHRGALNTSGMWRGEASADDWTRAMRAVSSAPTRETDFIRMAHAKSGMVDEVVASMAKLVHVHRVAVLFVDYLQVIQVPVRGVTNRRDITDLVLARLTSAARSLDVPLVLMSQLSRAEKGGNRFPEPFLADLKESGTLENSSAAVVMLWIMTDDKTDERFGIVKAKVAKTKDDERGARWAMQRGHGQVLREIRGWTEPQEPKRRGY